MYEALVSFATKIISMFKGQVAEIDDPEIVEDLLAAKYIEAYSPQPSGGGYDAVIKATVDDIGDITDLQLESGSYENLVAAIQSKKSVDAILYGERGDSISSSCLRSVIYDTYVPEGEDPFLVMSFFWAGIWMDFYLGSDNTIVFS